MCYLKKDNMMGEKTEYKSRDSVWLMKRRGRLQTPSLPENM